MSVRASPWVMPAVGSSRRSRRGLRGQGARDLQAPLVAIGEAAGHVVGVVGEPDALEQRRAPIPQVALHAAEARAVGQHVPQSEADARVHAHQDVLDGGHVAEEPDVLERPAHPEPA